MTPTASTLQELRRLGYLAAVVERWLPRVERKADLFGIGDVLAVHPRDRQLLLVQCTSAAHVPDRVRRVQGRPELAHLLAAGVAVEVWGWQLVRGRSHCREEAVRSEDMKAVEMLPLPHRRQGRKGLRQRTCSTHG
jgi:hypothetical protein